MRGFRSLVIGCAASLTLLSSTGTALADDDHDGHRGHDVEVVKAMDDCDAPTFNKAIGPGTCVRDGDTTFNSFLAQLQRNGFARGWAFDPPHPEVDQGERIKVVV